jgi:hypothetical protein
MVEAAHGKETTTSKGDLAQLSLQQQRAQKEQLLAHNDPNKKVVPSLLPFPSRDSFGNAVSLIRIHKVTRGEVDKEKERIFFGNTA